MLNEPYSTNGKERCTCQMMAMSTNHVRRNLCNNNEFMCTDLQHFPFPPRLAKPRNNQPSIPPASQPATGFVPPQVSKLCMSNRHSVFPSTSRNTNPSSYQTLHHITPQHPMPNSSPLPSRLASLPTLIPVARTLQSRLYRKSGSESPQRGQSHSGVQHGRLWR